MNFFSFKKIKILYYLIYFFWKIYYILYYELIMFNNNIMGIGDWGLGPIPNPQSPIPNPHTKSLY